MGVKEKNNVREKKVIESLENLARRLGIPLKRGMKKNIAKFFGIPQSQVSQWIRRRKIPDEKLQIAAINGQAPALWYVVPDEGEVIETAEIVDTVEVGSLLKLDVDKICDQYPQLKYALMYAQDGDEAELHRVIQKWAAGLDQPLGEVNGVPRQRKAM